MFKRKKKSKELKGDLVPKGIATTVIPKDYLKKFPHNDLAKFSNKKEIIE